MQLLQLLGRSVMWKQVLMSYLLCLKEAESTKPSSPASIESHNFSIDFLVPPHTLKTSVIIQNGDSILNLLQGVFHSRINIELWIIGYGTHSIPKCPWEIYLQSRSKSHTFLNQHGICPLNHFKFIRV